MPRKGRDSFSDDDGGSDDDYYNRHRRHDSFDRKHSRQHEDRRDNRRDERWNDRRDDRRDVRRDGRRDDRWDDRRDDRWDDRRHKRRDDRRNSRFDSPVRERSRNGMSPDYRDSQKLKIPMKVNRSCTDVIFLILFLLVFIVWIVLAAIVFTQVNVGSMLTLKDGDGNRCGSGVMEKEKYLFVQDFGKCFKTNGFLPVFDCQGLMWCVEQCPTKLIERPSRELVENAVCKPNASERIAREVDEDMKIEILEEEIADGNCAKFIYPSTSVLSICIPDIKQPERNDTAEDDEKAIDVKPKGKNFDDFIKNLKPESVAQVVLDIWRSGFLIIGGFGVSLIMALLWMLSMRYFAGVVVWITTLLLPIVFGACAVLSAYWTFVMKDMDPEPFDTGRLHNFTYLLTRFEFRLAVLAVTALLFVIFFLVILFLRKRIAMTVALIKQASRAISSLPTLVVFPVFPYVLQAAGAVILISILCLISTLRSQLEKDGGESFKQACSEAAGVANVTKLCDHLVAALSSGWYVHAFNIVSGLWFVMFVNAFAYLVVAHAVANYFWTHKEEGTSFMAVGSSVGTALRYHLGSIAFGSLIVSIVASLRMVLEHFQTKTRQSPENSWCSRGMKCCSCCFYLLEKFLKYINKNAYIMIAMYGKNFCRSAAKAFSRIVANALRALVLTKVTGFVLFIAQVVTSGCAALILYFVVGNKKCQEALQIPPLYSVFVPVVATGLGSYVITSCFFNVYRSAVDTLFLCFLEDVKINDGTPQRPYVMSSELKRIFDKKNHKDTRDTVYA